MSDDAADYLATLERQGFTVVRAKRSGHLKVYDGPRLVAVQSGTPSEYRGLKNLRGHVRRYLRSRQTTGT